LFEELDQAAVADLMTAITDALNAIERNARDDGDEVENGAVAEGQQPLAQTRNATTSTKTPSHTSESTTPTITSATTRLR